MLVLAVHLDELVRQLAERARGGERAVDERSAAALVRDLPSHDRLAAVGALEDCLDGGLRFARADEIRRGAGAEQETHGLDEDGLAGPRLPRQDVEARLELDLDGLNHREAADAEEAEHVGGTSIV